MRDMFGLGEREATIMELLWSAAEPVTVRDVLDRLERPLAYTTVMTVLDNLHNKGHVTREKVGRAFQYRAAE
ncbi:BlaI/MecI/CopY family transcriptional regulator, partial [Mycobacteroides abscessus]